MEEIKLKKVFGNFWDNAFKAVMNNRIRKQADAEQVKLGDVLKKTMEARKKGK